MKKIIKSDDRIDWKSLYDKYKDDDEIKKLARSFAHWGYTSFSAITN